jgi:hypothetical protein
VFKGITIISSIDVAFTMAPQPRERQWPSPVLVVLATTPLKKSTSFLLAAAIVDAGASRHPQSQRSHQSREQRVGWAILQASLKLFWRATWG